MPHKHNADRRHHIPKMSFKVQNWPAYEAGLRQRGSLTLWIEDAAEKDAVYQSYALAGNHTGYCDTQQGCEIDHLISLELGGSNDHPTSSNMTRHFIPNSRLQRPGGPIAPPTFWTVSIVPGRPGCITSFLSSRTGSGLFPRISAAPGTARLIEFE
jgi:hypothetical protein